MLKVPSSAILRTKFCTYPVTEHPSVVDDDDEFYSLLGARGDS